jgi:hypothetical protein
MLPGAAKYPCLYGPTSTQIAQKLVVWNALTVDLGRIRENLPAEDSPYH